MVNTDNLSEMATLFSVKSEISAVIEELAVMEGSDNIQQQIDRLMMAERIIDARLVTGPMPNHIFNQTLQTI